MKTWYKFINLVWRIKEPVSTARASLSLWLTVTLLAVLAVLILRLCR